MNDPTLPSLEACLIATVKDRRAHYKSHNINWSRSRRYAEVVNAIQQKGLEVNPDASELMNRGPFGFGFPVLTNELRAELGLSCRTLNPPGPKITVPPTPASMPSRVRVRVRVAVGATASDGGTIPVSSLRSSWAASSVPVKSPSPVPSNLRKAGAAGKTAQIRMKLDNMA